MKRIMFIFAVIIGIIFTACEKNEEINNQIEKEVNVENLYENTEYNLDMRDFAMAVSKSMKVSPEFRKIIKDEANLKFDGDYDVVIKRIMHKEIIEYSDSKKSSSNRVKGAIFTVADLLSECMSKNAINNNMNSSMQKIDASSTDVIANLTEKYPNLQVAIPVNIEYWDEVSETPTVTFIPAEFRDGETKAVIGYKADGSIVEIDAINEPKNEPIIVISECERSIEPIIMEPEIPSRPFNLSYTETELGIRLTWSMSSRLFVNGYRIYRKSTNDPQFVLFQQINGSLNSAFDDITVIPSKSYTYKVTAFNESYESEPSDPITLTAKNRTTPKSVISFEVIQRAKNQIELIWSNDYTIPFISTSIEKWVIGASNSYLFVDNLAPNRHTYIDEDISLGKKIIYRVAQITDSTISNYTTDFVQVPYRDITQPSPVYLLEIGYSCDVGDIESWLKGAPEFAIKTLTVDANGKTYEYQDEMELALDNRNFKRKSFSDKKIATWFTNRWYDKLTFHAVEKDTETTVKLTLNAKVNIKDSILNVIKPDIGLGTEIEIRDNSEKCGYGWLDYFEYPYKTIDDFVNYGFYMVVHDTNIPNRR